MKTIRTTTNASLTMTAVILAAILIIGLGGSACQKAQSEESRMTMVFVDLSLSTLPDRNNYKEHLAKIIAKLKAGDRLTVCKIIDLTIADFEPIFDITVPSFDMWTENRTNYERFVSNLNLQVMATIDSVLNTRSKVQQSEIISAFMICDQMTRGQRGKKSLVLISDMQESSPELDFGRDKITPEYIGQAITALRQKGRVPRLQDVEVWVAGAYAKDTEQYYAVQSFWDRYITETGATLRSYSHTLLNFE